MHRPKTPHNGLSTPHFPSPKARPAPLHIQTPSPEPVLPILTPVSPILYPRSAPAKRHKPPAMDFAPQYAETKNRSLSMGIRDRDIAGNFQRRVLKEKSQISEPPPLSSVMPKSPLAAVTEVCSLLISGQSELKARLRQHEVVLQRLNRPQRRASPKELIQEIREHSRKSARKLWSRSETPNTKVPPIAYSQIPTPRGKQSRTKRAESGLAISPGEIRWEDLVTRSNLAVSSKASLGKQIRFPRNVFIKKRRL